jgi:hypothetical protein
MNPRSNEWSWVSGDPDREVLKEAQKGPEGDLRAFDQLLLRHQETVVANWRHITGDPNNAEDLAQEVPVKVYFGLRSFDGKSSLVAWLQRIKVNHSAVPASVRTSVAYCWASDYLNLILAFEAGQS